MGCAQRLALQRRAVESERAVGTTFVAKMRTISLSEARPLQAPVGRLVRYSDEPAYAIHVTVEHASTGENP